MPRSLLRPSTPRSRPRRPDGECTCSHDCAECRCKSRPLGKTHDDSDFRKVDEPDLLK